MDLGLKNKNALITGGSQGIGFAIAKALAEEGCNVAIGARGRERIDQAATELSKLGVKAVPIAVDFTTEEGCRAFVENAVAALGGCDILVNNVGGTIPGTLGTFTVEKWGEIIDYAVTCPDLGRPANAAKYFKSSSIAPLRHSGGGGVCSTILGEPGGGLHHRTNAASRRRSNRLRGTRDWTKIIGGTLWSIDHSVHAGAASER